MLRKFAMSKKMDLLGLVIVAICAYLSGYLTETLQDVTHWGAWSALIPFGILSTVASMISLMSDRLQARLKNLGNYLSVIAVVTSGIVDYLLGNKGAIFTYPISFILSAWAIRSWKHSKKYKANKPLKGFKAVCAYTGIILGSFIVSYYTNLMGFTAKNSLFYLTVIVFALSLSANFLNALKLTTQWPFWFVYNMVQLIKAVNQMNFANVGKYIYYIFNALAGLFVWHTTTDKKGAKVSNDVSVHVSASKA